MENQTPNYYRRKIGTFVVFAVFFIFLGRQLTFLPTLNLSRDAFEQDLKKEVSENLEKQTGFYSIYYKDLKTGNSFGIDEHQVETGASVNKVPIVASLYFLNERGEINLDEKVTINDDDIQDYGTGTLRYQKMPQTLSLRNLAKLSLKESDNTAAHVLSVRIGEDVVQKFVNDWGMTQTRMADNQTSNYDMSILFERIYKGKIANAANTKELLSFMTETDIEDRLSKELPKNIKIYHKSGDGEGFVHDVGIIETEKHTYYLGVMTSDVTGKEKETASFIAKISEKIFKKIYR